MKAILQADVNFSKIDFGKFNIAKIFLKFNYAKILCKFKYATRFANDINPAMLLYLALQKVLNPRKRFLN